MPAPLELSEEDRRFYEVYGAWAAYTPAEAAAVMDGFPAPWWVVGGRAIEAFTGVEREHEDLDLSIFSVDFAHLRRQLEPRFHLWSNDGGLFRHVDDDHPEPLAPLAQTWVREHAGAPWVMDVILNGKGDGVWKARRDLELEAPLDEVTWLADGVRYLNPELVLFFKGRQLRPKDELDLAAALPLLSGGQRVWLADAIRTGYGADHAWLSRLE